MSLRSPQKDIGEYEEKIVGKLSFRTLVCVAGGFGSAILVATICHFWIGIEVADAAFPSCAHRSRFGSPVFGVPSGCARKGSRPFCFPPSERSETPL